MFLTKLKNYNNVIIFLIKSLNKIYIDVKIKRK